MPGPFSSLSGSPEEEELLLQEFYLFSGVGEAQREKGSLAPVLLLPAPPLPPFLIPSWLLLFFFVAPPPGSSWVLLLPWVLLVLLRSGPPPPPGCS